MIGHAYGCGQPLSALEWLLQDPKDWGAQVEAGPQLNPHPSLAPPSREDTIHMPLALGVPSHSASGEPHLHWTLPGAALPRPALHGLACAGPSLKGTIWSASILGSSKPTSCLYLLPILPTSATGPHATHPLHAIPVSLSDLRVMKGRL